LLVISMIFSVFFECVEYCGLTDTKVYNYNLFSVLNGGGLFSLLRRKHLSLDSVSTLLLRLFSWFHLKMRKDRRLHVFFHSVGLSTLGAAIFLQGLVLGTIFLHGYFRGVEQNFFVLSSEIVLMAFAISYVGYLFWRLVLSAT
jgi:hypothetical protein